MSGDVVFLKIPRPRLKIPCPFLKRTCIIIHLIRIICNPFYLIKSAIKFFDIFSTQVLTVLTKGVIPYIVKEK